MATDSFPGSLRATRFCLPRIFMKMENERPFVFTPRVVEFDGFYASGGYLFQCLLFVFVFWCESDAVF